MSDRFTVPYHAMLCSQRVRLRETVRDDREREAVAALGKLSAKASAPPTPGKARHELPENVMTSPSNVTKATQP